MRRPKLGDFVASVVLTSFRCLTLIPGTACSLALVPSLSAQPIELVNPSGEINPGLDRTLISETSVIGWQSNGGQVINDRTDFGNGGWRLSFEDSQEISQMTSQVIQSGDAFSLRFDASLFATGNPVGNLTLIGGRTRNGNFNANPSVEDSRSFNDTPDWFNLGSGQGAEATRSNFTSDGTRNAVAKQDGTRVFANDTGHLLAEGDVFRATYQWRDASGWEDNFDKVAVSLYVTTNNAIDGPRTIVQSLLSKLSSTDSTYQSELATFNPINASHAGKRLFVSVEGIDGNDNNAGFFRLDNFSLERVTEGDDDGTNPANRRFIAELYVNDNGTPLPVISRTYAFKTPSVGNWDHYHLAAPAGSLDAHIGKTIGIRFRGVEAGDSNFQSVDHIRLDHWPSDVPDGSFSSTWDNTPDQPWAGPGYWANRLQDWEVKNGRVQCRNGSRDRLTLHRPGSSIRGNGEDFSLSVRTGLNTGAHGSNSRAGFLLGAAPNVDWHGALLVHDGLGRDFGFFLGLTGGGNLVIEDYGTGAVTTVANTNLGRFPQNTRLDLQVSHQETSGTCILTLRAFNEAGLLLGTTALEVPSDRTLGAFGLLSHHGGSGATHWFDDFSGSGDALHPESDRHLAILGAMHTLSKQRLKLTAQLSPLSLAENPELVLEIWRDNSWHEIATTPVDQSNELSSYTATFDLPGWNDHIDTEYRLRLVLDDVPHTWTGTIPRDPMDHEEIVIAMTTCQRINDRNLQNNDFDWTPEMVWQPHTQLYTHLAQHNPDILLALGDQIYEGQPTSPDKSSDRNRQLDYLYKWNLWVLQARELTRRIPTIALPDDHDVFQGNLWGEAGKATNNQNTGGYTEPASWVRMVERTQTSHLPAPDPYNPKQPTPGVGQGIGVYFTGLTYGRLGFAILEDRKFKTGPSNPPADPANQDLLGERQHDFLRAWNQDWQGQDLKLVVSQSPFATLRTHSSSNYNYSLNDRDTHGWPVHRRNEAWHLLRVSRMFQLAGDQHLATLVHHGVESPRDAGLSFTAPAIANFFPRIFDPLNNSTGTTPIVSPYLGDYFFDGKGTLPDGVTPNRTAGDPHHFAILGAGNSEEYYQRSRGIRPTNLHDRGAGYGITRVNRTTREVTFECWPIHADPAQPSTGGQFPDWPQTFRQTDNDGRVPTGHLPLIDTLWRSQPVVRVFDETSGELIHAMRIRGSRYRPPIYDNSHTYRVEIAYYDDVISEVRPGQVPVLTSPPAINLFRATRPSVITGSGSFLEWDVSAPATLAIDQGIGPVLEQTIDGIGWLPVHPSSDTTYTLTLNESQTATTTVRVFPDRAAWNTNHFSAAELADPAVSGSDADPDGDAFTNGQEFQFQTNPRSAASQPRLAGSVVNHNGLLEIRFKSSFPLEPEELNLLIETSESLEGPWTPIASNRYLETERDHYPTHGTSRIGIRFTDEVSPRDTRRFYRASWILK